MLSRDEFNTVLADRGTLVIDGALATELEARGHDLNHALWSAKILKEDPESIKRVHQDYYLAGADIAITASYQASAQGLQDHFGMNDDEAKKLIENSVQLAREACDEAYQQGVNANRKLLVAGSVGPYGAYLADGSEYRGDYMRTKTEYQSFHRPRIQALVKGGVDLLAIETMPNLDEIIAVLELLREEFAEVIYWLSCTIENTQHISNGTQIESLLDLVNRHSDQIVAFGINCVPADIACEALRHIKALTDLPLLCYPNSGEIWNAESNTWSGQGGGRNGYESLIRDWQTEGARLIGGCCRTGPEYIKLVVGAITGK